MEKIFRVWFGKPLREVYAHATRFQVFKYRLMNFMRKGFITATVFSLLLSALYGSFVAGSKLSPVTVWAEKKVEVQVKNFPPFLTKICNAESSGKQFTKNGKVVRGQVNPSDIGFCQINEPTWNDKARELGYDIYTEKGNKDMALYIFENYGTDPWNSSKSAWSK